MRSEFTCISCPVGCKLMVDDNENVTGNRCPRGLAYALQEIRDPKRTVTSTVATTSETKKRLSVKTDKPIAKDLMFKVISKLRHVVIDKEISVGDILIPHILGTDVNIIATDDFRLT